MPLLRLFLDICLLRKGPQDTPASWVLLKLMVAAYFLAGMAQVALSTGWLEGFLEILLQGAILLAFVYISLLAAGKLNRCLQTLNAMLGTDALLSGFAIPVQALLLIDPQAGLVHLLLLLLMLWHLLVIAHILRHALSQTFAVALGLSIVYFVFTLQLLVLLFGPAPSPA